MNTTKRLLSGLAVIAVLLLLLLESVQAYKAVLDARRAQIDTSAAIQKGSIPSRESVAPLVGPRMKSDP